MPQPTVIVTRPVAQAGAWVQALASGGVDAVAMPLIEIVPAPDPGPVVAAWSGLGRYRLVFFVSPSAIDSFFELAPPGRSWPAQTLAAVPGPGSGAALRARGVPARQLIVPEPGPDGYEAMALWPQLGTLSWPGRSVLVVRGEGGREELPKRLQAAGAVVDFLAAYGRRCPGRGAAMHRLLQQVARSPAHHLWLFSSSEAVHNLVQLAPELPGGGWHALCTHARIATAARQAGFAGVRQCEASAGAVVRACRDGSIQSAAP